MFQTHNRGRKCEGHIRPETLALFAPQPCLCGSVQALQDSLSYAKSLNTEGEK